MVKLLCLVYLARFVRLRYNTASGNGDALFSVLIQLVAQGPNTDIEFFRSGGLVAFHFTENDQYVVPFYFIKRFY